MKFSNQHKKSAVLFYVLIGYVVAQVCWWIYQIIQLSQQLDNSGGVVEKKIRMLAGEFAVFFFLLCAGVIFISRVFRRETKLEASKKNFSLSITHELKTPITTTKLLVETLQNHELSSAKKEEIYDRVLVEQTRLQKLIEKILLSERIENSSIVIKKEETNMRHFTNEIVGKIEAKQEVKLKINEEFKAKIDPFYFQSVISNLLENAIKYSPENSTIIVEVRLEENRMLFLVKDEGEGILKEEKVKIFDLYYRLEDENLKTTNGTGLGLSLVKKIVQLHGGVIRVLDNKPKGSVFEVDLPMK